MGKIASIFKFKEKETVKPVYHANVEQQRFYTPSHIFSEKEMERVLENLEGERVSLQEECVKGIDFCVTPMRLVSKQDINTSDLIKEDNEDVCPCCYRKVAKGTIHTVFYKYGEIYACENSTIAPAYFWDGNGIYDVEEDEAV